MSINLNAYYYSFDPTGVPVIDEILSEVAAAGSGSHHTEDWAEYGHIERIQTAAAEAAEEFYAVVAAERKRQIVKGIQDALDARFEDGGSVAEYIFATNPELKRRLRNAIFGKGGTS
jgi:hypothetical protein